MIVIAAPSKYLFFPFPFKAITVNSKPALYSLDVSLVVILLLDERPLPVDENLQLLAELEHLHAAARQAGLLGGLPQLEDPLGEKSVLS